MINDQLEFFVDKIMDECNQHEKMEYLIWWQGEGPEGDLWLPVRDLTECEALDKWQARTQTKLMITLPPPCRTPHPPGLFPQGGGV